MVFDCDRKVIVYGRFGNCFVEAYAIARNQRLLTVYDFGMKKEKSKYGL